MGKLLIKRDSKKLIQYLNSRRTSLIVFSNSEENFNRNDKVLTSLYFFIADEIDKDNTSISKLKIVSKICFLSNTNVLEKNHYTTITIGEDIQIHKFKNSCLSLNCISEVLQLISDVSNETIFLKDKEEILKGFCPCKNKKIVK